MVTYGAMVRVALEAAETAAEEDQISVEVIDMRTLLPYDIDTLSLRSRKQVG